MYFKLHLMIPRFAFRVTRLRTDPRNLIVAVNDGGCTIFNFELNDSRGKRKLSRSMLCVTLIRSVQSQF